jgi:effector-binding domain-containing protein
MKLSLPPVKIRVRSIPKCWVEYRRATCSHDKIGETITAPNMLPGIYELARENDAHPGPPYARYLEWREKDCDMQIGVGLTKAIPSDGDITCDLYSACLAVVAEFDGAYDRLTSVHEACRDYIEREELKYGGACWEVYVGPAGADGVAHTEVYYPIEP